ncbi:MAG TPA: hypothetical protein VHA30_02125 [Patescibacteria group bacterium]|nr:hypothetical protein [Patescibacteria group bacterium]
MNGKAFWIMLALAICLLVGTPLLCWFTPDGRITVKTQQARRVAKAWKDYQTLAPYHEARYIAEFDGDLCAVNEHANKLYRIRRYLNFSAGRQMPLTDADVGFPLSEFWTEFDRTTADYIQLLSSKPAIKIPCSGNYISLNGTNQQQLISRLQDDRRHPGDAHPGKF